MSAVEHAARGTYVPCRHGPLPPGIIPLPRRPVLVPRGPRSGAAAPASPAPAALLTEADCPAVLSPDGRALWAALIVQRPTAKVLGAFVMMYIEALLAWQRATLEVQAHGDYGKLDKKRVPNPYLKLRQEAEASLYRAANFLGWQLPAAHGVSPEAPKSRLELFLMARGRP